MNTYRFYKENTGEWYVDLPDYPGPKADLQMVAGADTFLDKLGGKSNIVSLTVSEEPFGGSEHLKLLKECTGEEGGGDYILETYQGEKSIIRCGFVRGYAIFSEGCLKLFTLG
ncbi:DUF6717 family protein [Pedobacter sp. P351]